MKDKLQQYQTEVTQELTHNILPFYLNYVIDWEHGGFYGLITHNLTIQPEAPKALVQNSRILWAFAQAYRELGDPIYRDIADRAFHYLLDYFWDNQSGGLYWLLDYQGRPLEPIKMIYGQAFGIYGLSEYYLATGSEESLAKAIALYRLIEEYCHDSDFGGYFEGGNQNWTPLTGVSVDHVPAAKTMNTHLHVLEAYTNLLRAWADPSLQATLKTLIQVTLQHLIDPDSGHFKLHFDAAWQSQSNHLSYGHDIEGSWLLVEAAEVIGDHELEQPVKQIALKIAQTTLAEGLDADGGLFNEGSPAGITDSNKDWWPQAEAMIGFLNAYQLTRQPHFLEASLNSWQFVQQYLIDKQHGEWFLAVNREGTPHLREKTGPWKAPYHNGRACMEVKRRLGQLLNE